MAQTVSPPNGRMARLDRRHDAIWLDGPVPAGFWDEWENRRRYLLWLGEQLGFESVRDWYRVTTDDVKAHRGGGVLKYAWNSSIIAGVRDCFPDYDWKDWLFGMCPRTFWCDPKNHKVYMNWLGQQLGIRRAEDWYNVTNDDFIRNKGGAFLLHYNCTISAAVMAHLPDYEWKEWLFRKIPKGFWHLKKNRLRYLKWLADRLEIRRMEGWYHLTRRHFEENCGNNLLKQFAGSPCLLLKDAYSRYPWKEWMFRRVPLGFWKRRENRRRYMDWLGKHLGYKTPEDWYQIRRSDFLQNYGGGLLASLSSYKDLLEEHLPDLDWNREALAIPRQ